MNRRAAEQRGRQGETLAAWWLRLHGWSVLARRVRHPLGEIDIIARRGCTLAFVEVKTRGHRDQLGLAIDERRLKRTAAAAQALAHRYARPGDAMRIDVILLTPWAWPVHIANAWHG